LIEEQLKREEEAIESLKEQELTINKSLLQAKKLLTNGLERVESIALRKSRLKSLAMSVQNAIRQLELAEESQKAEYKILASALLNPCMVLLPTFIPTTSATEPQHVEVSSCPICCYGFHCHNWIPGSCGHAYHPSCLFSWIGGSKIDPKCFACGAFFAKDWLECWGLNTFREDSNPNFKFDDLLLTTYGKQALHLSKRRSFLMQMLSVQQKVFSFIHHFVILFCCYRKLLLLCHVYDLN
jgi:hypothetical protein